MGLELRWPLLVRGSVAKGKELALFKQSTDAMMGYGWLASKLSLSFAIKVIVILGVGGLFRQAYVASVPASLLQPFGGMLAVKGRDADIVHISFMPWMLLCTTVASHLVDSVWRRRVSLNWKTR